VDFPEHQVILAEMVNLVEPLSIKFSIHNFMVVMYHQDM
jgi:hypothetical protein